MVGPDFHTHRNNLLAALAPDDLALLRPYLEPVDLEIRHVMERPGQDIADIYFPFSGLGSIVVVGSRARDQRIEAGMFGHDGMSGTAVVLGIPKAAHEVYMQMSGDGVCMPADALREAMEQRPSLRLRLSQYSHVLHLQITYTALANGRDSMERRLARWILMAHDRTEGDELSLTHEFLSLMLGVHRPGVTITLRELEKRGRIALRRGTIIVRDRDGLVETADGSYGGAEAEYERIFGGPI